MDKHANGVIRMEQDGLEDDFYETYESFLDDDEISAEEEGFMKGFNADMFEDQ